MKEAYQGLQKIQSNLEDASEARRCRYILWGVYEAMVALGLPAPPDYELVFNAGIIKDDHFATDSQVEFGPDVPIIALKDLGKESAESAYQQFIRMGLAVQVMRDLHERSMQQLLESHNTSVRRNSPAASAGAKRKAEEMMKKQLQLELETLVSAEQLQLAMQVLLAALRCSATC